MKLIAALGQVLAIVDAPNQTFDRYDAFVFNILLLMYFLSYFYLDFVDLILSFGFQLFMHDFFKFH